jgi:D-alanyl-D-alanine carboxypeptidase
VKTAVVISDDKAVLFGERADNKVYPASLAKLATLYVLFQRLKSGSITMNTRFSVSSNAASQIPSKLGLMPGSTISVLDCICALTVKSANDVAVVVAEGIAGSVAKFCRLMNQLATRTGMKNTHFKNPSGLFAPGQVTTARDLATLGLALYRDFPEYMHFLSMKTFKFGHSTHPTHCKILHWCNAVDGAKTGYIRQSGFNLFVTARNPVTGKRVVVVVTGGSSPKSRDVYAGQLINTYTRSGLSPGKSRIAGQVSKSLYAQIDCITPPGTHVIAPKDQRQQSPHKATPPVPKPPPEVIKQDDEVMLDIGKWYNDEEGEDDNDGSVVVETGEQVKVSPP